MNRIDKVVVFRSLHDNHLREILEIELRAVQRRITEGTGEKFVFKCTDAAKHFLLEEGIDFKYGARHLKRAIERFLVYPLSNLIATDQVGMGDLLLVDYSSEIGKLVFVKDAGGTLILEETRHSMFSGQSGQGSGSAIALARPEWGPAPKLAKNDQNR
jgi:ATP-dependent Clp protease ATP-binding subunit ClpA